MIYRQNCTVAANEVQNSIVYLIEYLNMNGFYRKIILRGNVKISLSKRNSKGRTIGIVFVRHIIMDRIHLILS